MITTTFRAASRLAAALALTLLLGACGGGSSGSASEQAGGSSSISADVTVLMLGNSHTSASQLPNQLETILRTGLPGKTVAVVVAPLSAFLDDHLVNPSSMALLRSRQWTAIVLQAQKYSTTGMFTYSTDAAEALIEEARKSKALPVLFPEWPRRGVAETDRIFDLHVSIARKQPACVAPIGQAWDLSMGRLPTLALHADDGNHSVPAGAHLAALMLYATMTGKSPSDLGALVGGTFGMSSSVQAHLRQVAAETTQRHAPRQHCPADMPIGAN